MTEEIPKSEKSFFKGIAITVVVLAAVGIVIALVIIFNNDDTNAESATADEQAVPEDGGPVQVEPIDSIDLENVRYTKGSGDLTFIEYSDLECPFCKTFHSTSNTVLENYNGQVAYTYKHLPLNIHPKAKREHIAAECAGQQDKFFEFVSEVYEVTPSNNKLEDSELFRIADELGLDSDTFTTCVDTEVTLAAVAADAMEAQGTGATGTPHSLIVDKNGKILTAFRGALSEEQMTGVLDQLLTGEDTAEETTNGESVEEESEEEAEDEE
ncbi:DsbA family protein [Patescibacteria group bacterium]